MSEETLIIKDGVVVTMDPATGILENGSVVIQGNRLAEITDQSVEKNYPGAALIDAAGCAVLPGLVNCHSHLRPGRAQGEGMDVATWHTHVVDGISESMTPDDAYYGASSTYLEMLKNGITTALSMSILEPDDMRAAVDTGIRARIACHAVNMEQLENTIRLCEEQTGSEDDRVRLWLGMDMSSFFDQDQLTLVNEVSQRYGLPVHVHWSEYKEEPLERLEKPGLLRRGLILAHCVHVSEESSARMAKARVSVSHNVRSNAKFGSGIAPLQRYLQQGVLVGLGTDGPLSTYACNILEEMRTATLIARAISRDPSAVTVEQAIELVTIRGAEVLCLEDQIGSLTAGKKADVLVLDLNQPHFRPLHVGGPLPNLMSLLAFAADGRDVRDVIVDGRVVVRKGEVQTVDEEKVMAECQARGDRLLRVAADEISSQKRQVPKAR